MIGFRMAESSPSPDPHEEERRKRLLALRSAQPKIDDPRVASDCEVFDKAYAPANESSELSPVVLTAPPGENTIVPKQLRFESTLSTHIIADDDADLSCAQLGSDDTLKALNRIFRTRYTLDTPFLRPHIQRVVDDAFDAGLAYAYFRPRWHSLINLGPAMEENRTKDEQLRANALREDKIVDPFIPPRRVWDLWSNRVVPHWIMSSHLITPDLWAVSHSWMSLDKRRDILTNINGRKWPVPIPTDASLECVRIELLNLGAEYVWLDVLCLRQYGGVEEYLRADEWKLDVPTIGRVYHAGRNRNTVCYFSGLGRPFTVEEGFLNDPRHWLNRAWTLQETKADWIVGGVTDESPVAPENYGGSPGDSFYEILDSLVALFADRPANALLVLAAMQKRDSVNPVDKIAGLGYILRSPSLPVYQEKEDVEDAWTRLIENMDDRFRADMLFLYPSCGDGSAAWRPSWKQITQTELPKVAGIEVAERVVYNFLENIPAEYDHVYWYNGPTLTGCFVRGLSIQSPNSGQKLKRKGQLIVHRRNIQYSFEIFARHDQVIPEDQFSLIAGGGYEYWVVGTTDVLGTSMSDTVLKFHKVSVLRMNELERERLQRLRLCTRRDVFLY